MFLRNNLLLILLFLISAGLLLSFFYFTAIPYLTFSDGAKYADVARNLYQGMGYGSRFATFPSSILDPIRPQLFAGKWILPIMPLMMLVSFNIVGVSDLAVIITSSIFYLGVAIMTFLIGKKIWSGLVGFLAGVAIAAHLAFLGYATTGATETLFAFEILLTVYLFLKKERLWNIAGFLGFGFLYYTRPHAPIFIVILAIFYILLNSKKIEEIIKKLGLVAFLILAFALLGHFLQGRFFISSIIRKGLYSTLQFSAIEPGNSGLRQIVNNPLLILTSNILIFIKKFLYNLYNFYKLLPEIASPYLWALFAIGAFKWGKDKVENSFKLTVIIMLVVVFGINAATIPLYRYLHPVIPFVYLIAVAMLVWIIEKIYSKQKYLILSLVILMSFFVIGQSLGFIFLDSRFKNKTVNRDKPPVYVVLAKILKENTNFLQTVVTNLDTWGTWYGERKTVWYPLTPSQLTELDPAKVSFDAIYLTSYLIDDENYAMGPEWRQIFDNPNRPVDGYIASKFKLQAIYEIPARDTYEGQPARAVLMVRK